MSEDRTRAATGGDDSMLRRSDDMPNRTLDLSLPAPRTRGETVRLIQSLRRRTRAPCVEDTVGERLPVNSPAAPATAGPFGGTVVAGPAETAFMQAARPAHYRWPSIR